MGINRGATNLDKDSTNSKTEKKLYNFLLDKGLITEYIEWEEKNKPGIPVHIFNSTLGPYESICKYLKEQGFKNAEIARMTGRDSKSVWQAINKAKKKYSKKFLNKKSEYVLPYDVLQDDKYSILENIVTRLKTQYNLGFTKIGELIDRDPRTIWTIYQRSIKR
ncbi:hypothetical protein C0585_03985 [Candidatus Woesearchaeota archaeon]|nr:MAG: hypothetical protein C0585_03985 [Candidatus Woesearchaeota archaeon]